MGVHFFLETDHHPLRYLQQAKYQITRIVELWGGPSYFNRIASLCEQSKVVIILEQIFWVVVLTELILVCLCFVVFDFDNLPCICICFLYIIECNWQSHWLHRVCYKWLICIFEYLAVSLSHLVWRLYCIVWLVIILTVLSILAPLMDAVVLY